MSGDDKRELERELERKLRAGAAERRIAENIFNKWTECETDDEKNQLLSSVLYHQKQQEVLLQMLSSLKEKEGIDGLAVAELIDKLCVPKEKEEEVKEVEEASRIYHFFNRVYAFISSFLSSIYNGCVRTTEVIKGKLGKTSEQKPLAPLTQQQTQGEEAIGEKAIEEEGVHFYSNCLRDFSCASEQKNRLKKT